MDKMLFYKNYFKKNEGKNISLMKLKIRDFHRYLF